MKGPILLATRSPGKLREVRQLVQAAGFAVTDLNEAGIAEREDEAALESFDTFEENALAKGRYFHVLSGLPAVADDSGLMVRALGGKPGVHSKRWSARTDLAGQALDDENNRKLLSALAGSADRRARYVCVAAYVDEGLEIVERGETSGVITAEPRGRGGFGYDPYFLSDELGKTFAQATLDEKQLVSHRGRAFRKLLGRLL